MTRSYLAREGEGVVLHELAHRVEVAVLRGDLARLDDLDALRANAVAGGHVRVELVDGAVERHVAELLVHVVEPRAGLVTDPDAVVLHARRVLLEDLVARDDVTVGLLDPAELGEEVPARRGGVRGRRVRRGGARNTRPARRAGAERVGDGGLAGGWDPVREPRERWMMNDNGGSLQRRFWPRDQQQEDNAVRGRPCGRQARPRDIMGKSGQ